MEEDVVFTVFVGGSVFDTRGGDGDVFHEESFLIDNAAVYPICLG